MDNLVSLYTRVPQELHKKLRMHCVDRDLTMQSVICESLKMYIKKYENLVEELRKK